MISHTGSPRNARGSNPQPTLGAFVSALPARGQRAARDWTPLLEQLAERPGQWATIEINGAKPESYITSMRKAGMATALREGVLYACVPK